jgi:Pin2-interacting protein X1
MGLSEGKRKTRLVGSAVTKNSAWTNDTSLPGQRLLSSMGWSQGQGLGTSSQGTAVPITMAFKMDNKGIGARRFEKEARANGVADAWVGGAGQLGDLFERLNKASGSTAVEEIVEIEPTKSKSKSSKKDRKDEKSEKRGGKGKSKERSDAVPEADEAKVETAVEKVASALPHRMA